MQSPKGKRTSKLSGMFRSVFHSESRSENVEAKHDSLSHSSNREQEEPVRRKVLRVAATSVVLVIAVVITYFGLLLFLTHTMLFARIRDTLKPHVESRVSILREYLKQPPAPLPYPPPFNARSDGLLFFRDVCVADVHGRIHLLPTLVRPSYNTTTPGTSDILVFCFFSSSMDVLSCLL